MRNLAKLLKDEHILRLTNVHFEKDRICKACQAGKQVGAPHPPNRILTTSSLLELIHKTQPPRNFLEVPGSGSSTPQDTLNQQVNQQGDVQASTSEPQADEDNEDQPLHQPLGPSHPRVHQVIQQDHPVDNILGSIRRGVTT
jgi:hypothetical protein